MPRRPVVIGIIRMCFWLSALLCSARPAAAQLNLAADIWTDDEIGQDGNLWVYGEGMARSDAGWVVAAAQLRDPAGGELDAASDLGTGTARAEVAYSMDVSTAPEGDYSTFATGEDEYEYHGCDVKWLGIQPVLQQFYKEQPEDPIVCGFQTYKFRASCEPSVCSVGTEVCLPVQNNYAATVRAQLTTAGFSWCTPNWKVVPTVEAGNYCYP